MASSFFLILWNSSPNSFAFAKHALLAAIPTADSSKDFDARLVRLIAVAILTIICLMHYFSSKLGLFLNKILALFKALLLFSIFIAGMVAAKKQGSGTSDWTEKHGPGGKTNGVDSIAAFVLILYSYTGWENANYVS
jgi:amino acid transporter